MRTFLTAIALVLPLSLSACGQDKPQADSQGKQIFISNCDSCHTLSDSGSQGVAGPNLDTLAPSKEQVVSQVTNGGGGMPAFAGTLSEQQIQQVADYVSSAAGGN